MAVTRRGKVPGPATACNFGANEQTADLACFSLGSVEHAVPQCREMSSEELGISSIQSLGTQWKNGTFYFVPCPAVLPSARRSRLQKAETLLLA